MFSTPHYSHVILTLKAQKYAEMFNFTHTVALIPIEGF